MPAWCAVLQDLGLRADDDDQTYRNGRIVFRVRSGWGVFESKGKVRRSDTLRGQLGRAGLWKLLRDDRGSVRRVFELPPQILALAEWDAARFEAVAGWALATAGGKAGRCREPPARAEVERWLPEKALSLQVGPIVRQGTLTVEDGRLALGFPVVSQIPQDLPAGPDAWLRELLVDAQNRWRLVRIGWNGTANVQAEVDLTGAPHEVLEELVQISVDALRIVVSSIVEPADFLINGARGCRAVEVRPNRA